MLDNYKYFFPVDAHFDVNLFQINVDLPRAIQKTKYFFQIDHDFDFNVLKTNFDFIPQAIEKKKDFLINLLMKNIVNFANDFFHKKNTKSTFIHQTSLKEYFINRMEITIKTDIYNEKEKTSNLATNMKIFYNLERLNEIFKIKRPTPFDNEIKEKLKAVEKDMQLLDIGIELDIENIKKHKQLIFTHFELKPH